MPILLTRPCGRLMLGTRRWPALLVPSERVVDVQARRVTRTCLSGSSELMMGTETRTASLCVHVEALRKS